LIEIWIVTRKPAVDKELKKLQEKIKETREKVMCGYLDLSYGLGLSGGITGMLVECHNNQCGFQNGCDYLEKGQCEYRSAKIKVKFLYDPDGFQKYLRKLARTNR
jgi:hypothetical protein